MQSEHRMVYSLKPGFSFYKASDTFGYLVGEKEQFCISGYEFVYILSRIDGVISDETIARQLETRISVPEAYFAFLRLKSLGYVVLHDEQTVPLSDVWWCQFDADRSQIESIKRKYFFSVYATEKRYSETMHALLSKHGLNSVEGNTEKIALVLCADYLQPEVTEIVQQLEAKNLCYFLVKPAHKSIWFGPILGKEDSPCWSCVTYFLRQNRPVESFVETWGFPKVNQQWEPDLTDESIATACNLSLVHLIGTILNNNGIVEKSSISILSPSFLKMENHRIIKRKQCAQCGDPGFLKKQMRQAVELREDHSKYQIDGGYRHCTPFETWERFKHLVSPVTGVVCHVDPFGPKDHQLRPVWHASYYANPKSNKTGTEENFVRKSFGKGHSREQARVSALCEAIERFSCMFQGDEPVVRGSYLHLVHKNAIDPATLLNFSDRQYQTRDSHKHEDRTQAVPLLFDRERETDWTYAWSLIHAKQYLVPLSYCFSEVPASAEQEMCPFNPNGHAAGNTLEEAILQAFLELVERDAVGIWWYNRLKRSEIDLESFDDPYFIKVQEHYLNLGWQIWVLDLTTDLQIPSVISIARHFETKDYFIGMGSHLDFHLAVQRAITEMHQIFDPSGVQEAVWNENQIESPDFLFPVQGEKPVVRTCYKVPESCSIKGDIEFCMEKVKQIGSDFLVLNHTRPDIGLATVKVIVPGLRHFWRRLGPGRLYDVPVKMGWLEKPYPEAFLNPLALKV